jgi:hypothetical protein
MEFAGEAGRTIMHGAQKKGRMGVERGSFRAERCRGSDFYKNMPTQRCFRVEL